MATRRKRNPYASYTGSHPYYNTVPAPTPQRTINLFNDPREAQAWMAAGQPTSGWSWKPPAAGGTAGAAPQAAASTPASPFAGDSAYFSALAQSQFNANNQLSNISTTGAYDKTDYEEALRRLLEAKPKQIQSTRESANRSGLLFSGHLAEQEGEIEKDSVRQQGDMRLAYDRREAARIAARAAIEAGLPLDQAALYAQAVDRQTGRDQEAAASNSLAPPAASSPAAAGPSLTVRGRNFAGAVGSTPGSVGTGTGGTYRWYTIRMADGSTQKWRRYENGTWSNWTGR